MKFYDTNALLYLKDKVFEEKFAISVVTLFELESIKTDNRKDPEVKYNARTVTRLLSDNDGLYIVVDSSSLPDTPVLPDRNDYKICYDALRFGCNRDGNVFVTGDISCRNIARNYFGLNVEPIAVEDFNDYTGYVEVTASDEEVADLYEHLDVNKYECVINQYVILRDNNGEVIDRLRWTVNGYVPVKRVPLKTNYFGDVKPFKGDVYQQCAIDAMAQNKITVLRGPAGSGKSYLAMAYMMKQLELGRIEKIIVFCNTVNTKNAAKLGFLPGTRNEKLLESSIGVMLSAKLGGSYAVESMIASGKLVLLPMCDIRGFDTTNMSAAIYITEAQNMDIELMRLALQRIGSDCFAVIDGDNEAQVDMSEFAGSNNGMRRLSQVFRGEDIYGEVKLQKIYRSKIAELAQKM